MLKWTDVSEVRTASIISLMIEELEVKISFERPTRGNGIGTSTDRDHKFPM
jgi:hypothetical protein